jgi:hypothetical protein
MLKLALDKPFDSVDLFGEGWSVWRGPVEGEGLEGEEDCVSEPDEIDFEEIILETHLEEGYESILGEEIMRRARSGKNRPLGGRAFQALWNNWQECRDAGEPEESVLEKLRKAEKIGNRIYFFGLTLRDSAGRRYVLYLYSMRQGWWDWLCHWLGVRWDTNRLSVSLASID